jgi:hypothetical protein
VSQGNNKHFLASPAEFMKKHVFNTQPDNSLANVSGIVKINLFPSGTWGAKNLPLVTVQRAPADRSKNSHAFDAYYLKWAEKEVTEIPLGMDANYFFTAAITGCRLIVGAGTQPLISHVDGGRFDDAAMDEMCNTRADGTSLLSKRYWDNGEHYATIVVGVLDEPPKKSRNTVVPSVRSRWNSFDDGS